MSFSQSRVMAKSINQGYIEELKAKKKAGAQEIFDMMVKMIGETSK